MRLQRAWAPAFIQFVLFREKFPKKYSRPVAKTVAARRILVRAGNLPGEFGRQMVCLASARCGRVASNHQIGRDHSPVCEPT